MLSKIRPLGSYHKTGWRWLRVLAAIYLLFMATCCLYPIATHPAYSHLVYDRQGQLLHATLSSDDKWRMEVLPADITPLLKQAILAKEDQYFYYHPGVNPLAIGRALVRNIWRGRTTSGASTITMQVVRLL
ncbi:MAG TPA: transglycosylase domain-containing protein, partial [Phnomibacter sp.]|nr:transglycosylase domain-containing protein [Phnomibacter sp.]